MTKTGQWLADWLADDGAVDRLPDGWDDPHALVRKIEAEAAQEAPAPEGLRDAALDLLAALRSWEQSWETSGEGYGGVRKAKIALARLAVPPSPAEPPRPDDERESGERLARIIQEADAENPEWARGARFVLGWTKGPDDAALEIAFQAVRDPATDRAEARPPEGLDADRLARAMHDENFCDNWSPGYWTLGPAPHHTPILDQAGDMAAHRRDADRLLARLSARGAEPR